MSALTVRLNIFTGTYLLCSSFIVTFRPTSWNKLTVERLGALNQSRWVTRLTTDWTEPKSLKSSSINSSLSRQGRLHLAPWPTVVDVSRMTNVIILIHHTWATLPCDVEHVIISRCWRHVLIRRENECIASNKVIRNEVSFRRINDEARLYVRTYSNSWNNQEAV